MLATFVSSLQQSDRMYTDIGYTFVMLQALLKHAEFVQNIVYAPGSVKVVFKGSEKTALVGKFALAPPIAILTKFFGKRKNNRTVDTRRMHDG